MAKIMRLEGKKYGKLTVVEFSHQNKAGNAVWKCVCDCGNTASVAAGNLRRGNTKSCGCLPSEIHTKHGRSNDYIFKLWVHIMDRCLNPKSPFYHRYGGRGIRIHEPWKDSSRFISDVISEIGERPEGCHSLDRKENDIGYFPGNIRWATWKQQANNKSNNRILEFKGESKTVSQWSESLGIDYAVILNRLRRGWSVKKALSTPAAKAAKINKIIAGEIRKFKGREFAKFTAKRFGVSDQTVYDVWNGERW